MTDQAKLNQWMLDIAGRTGANATYGVIPVVTELPAVRSMDNTWLQQVRKWMSLLTGVGTGAMRVGQSSLISTTKSGLSIFVGFPHTEGESMKLGSINTDIVTEISVAESRIYNTNATSGFAPSGVGLHADDVAIGLMLALENWVDGNTAGAARCKNFQSNHEGWLPTDLRDGSEKFDLFVCAFQIHAPFNATIPTRPYPPIITITGTSAALTCNTSGATYLYSIDGTYPTVAYTGAVTVASGQTVKAVAQKTNQQDSSLAESVVP